MSARARRAPGVGRSPLVTALANWPVPIPAVGADAYGVIDLRRGAQANIASCGVRPSTGTGLWEQRATLFQK
jgi:hypothetical protein